MSEMKWPYNIEFGQEECVESDILVLGGELQDVLRHFPQQEGDRRWF